MSLIMEEKKIVEISEETVREIQKQIFISDEEAYDLLLKHENDIVSAILDYNYNIVSETAPDPKSSLENNTDPIQNKVVNIDKCRDIINQKDNIYTTKSGEQINISDCEIFYYIPFTSNSTSFQKLKVNSIRNSFKETIIMEYLNDHLFSYQKEIINYKLVIKKLSQSVKKMYSKWGLINPTVFYYQHQIQKKDDLDLFLVNKLATKFLSKSMIIPETDIFIGPIVIVDNY